jgi:hypothetical protein
LCTEAFPTTFNDRTLGSKTKGWYSKKIQPFAGIKEHKRE